MVEENPTYLLKIGEFNSQYFRDSEKKDFIYREDEDRVLIFTKKKDCFVHVNIIDIYKSLKYDIDFRKDVSRVFLTHYSTYKQKITLVSNRSFINSVSSIMFTLKKSFNKKNVEKFWNLINIFLTNCNDKTSSVASLETKFIECYKKKYSNTRNRFFFDTKGNIERDFIPLDDSKSGYNFERDRKRKNHEDKLIDDLEYYKNKNKRLNNEVTTLECENNKLKQKLSNFKRQFNFMLDCN